MKVLASGNTLRLEPRTQILLNRMLCPLTGLSQEIGFVLRSPADPSLNIAGGEMTGVHVLRGAPPPERGAYHIGGCGFTYQEALIKTLGETLERYAQYMLFGEKRTEIRFASLDEMSRNEQAVLSVPSLQLFDDKQLARPGFPFSKITSETKIGWIPGVLLPSGQACWIPAQQGAVGYHGRPGEPRFAEGVTTGTAAHTLPAKAVRNALLELMQIDAAMGHWYGRGRSVSIGWGPRTSAVQRVIEGRLPRHASQVSYHWLQSADLPGFAIACIVRAPEVPKVAVGLGSDLVLDRAIYKAFLEASAVAQLAKVILLREQLDRATQPRERSDPHIYGLDANVARYACSDPEFIVDRFSEGGSVSAEDLPPDLDLDTEEIVRHLSDSFFRSGKRLAFLDFTVSDAAALGFYVARVWSPDMLTLSLPSAPPTLHPRFSAYGGFDRDEPHPYP